VARHVALNAVARLFEAKLNRPGDAPAINPRYLSEESDRLALPDGGLRCAHPPYACFVIIERETRLDRPLDPDRCRGIAWGDDSDQSAQF